MSNVKTAISLDSTLFQKAEDMARELNISRSRLFAVAIEKLLREYENRKITEALNDVYADFTPDPEDELFRKKMSEYQRKIVEGTW